MANRLAKLEAEELILKNPDPQNLTKFIYSLTQKGKDLLPLLLEMIEWSVQYNPQPGMTDNIISGAPSNLLKKLHKDREVLITEILSKLEEGNE